jgi:hypothetical protein
VPELLLVDVFPQGVAGELLPLLGRSRAWLIARRAPVRLFLETDARALVESRYERILWCETPDARLRSLAVAQADVEAILIADRKDTRLSLRQALNVADADALVVAIGTGPAQRQFNLCRLLGRICARLGATLRFFSLELPAQGPVCRRLPAAPYLRAADLVVCAAGYHAYHEALAAGALAIFLPQRRRYDDQFLRAAGQVQAQSPGELEARMREMLQRSAPPGMAKPWPRGAMQVAEMTRALLE